MSKSFPAFFQRVSGSFVKMPFYLSIAKLCENFLFRKLSQFFINLGHWANLFQPFLATFSGVGKTESSETREHLDELFLLENGLLIQVWTRIKFFFGLQQKSNKNLSKPLEECLYERFKDKQFFPKASIFYHFRTLSWSFALPGETFQLLYWNSSLSVYYINLRKIYSTICSVFLRVPDIEQEKIGLLSKLSRQDSQNCIVRVRKINPEKNFRTFLFLILSGHCAKFVWPLFKVFFSRFVKKKFYMSIETIQIFPKKNLLSNKNMFVIYYWNIEQNISGFLAENFLQVSKKSILFLLTKTLGNFFSDIFTALHRSWTLSESFPAIFGFFLTGWSKLRLSSPENTWMNCFG